MTIEIDVERLKAQKAELESQLTSVNGLIALAEQFAKVQMPVAPPQLSLPVAVAQAKHRVEEEEYRKRGFTPGLRRAVILALHTGPTSESDLAKSLAWTKQRTKTVVMSMLKYKVCYLDSFGKLCLSEEGRKQAGWYLINTARLTYSPGTVTA